VGVAAPEGPERLAWAWVAALALMAAAALMVSRIFALRENTLRLNGRWDAGKRHMKLPTVGQGAYFERPQALANGRLDLSAWHGYQEVFLRRPEGFDEIRFRFRLAAESYFYFLFERREAGFSALRLSASPLLPNAYVTGDGEGGFTGRKAVDAAGVRPGAWSVLRAAASGDSWTVSLDGTPVGTFPRSEEGGASFGFRGGAREVLIDDVEARSWSGEWLREDFSNRRGLYRWAVWVLAAVVLLNLAALKARARPPRERAFFLLALNLGLCLEAAALLWFFTATSRFYPKGGLQRDMPAAGPRYLKGPPEVMLGARSRGVEPLRVVFVGGSQTHGSGAADKSQTFPRRLEAELNRLAGRRRVEVSVVAIPGARAGSLLGRYAEQAGRGAPDVAAINLSFNDRRTPPEVFEAALRRFVELNRRLGTRTLFVLEANSPEHEPGELAQHPVMRRVAEEEGVPLADLHDCLKKRLDDGFLWWDIAHLTPYGHRAAAECLLGPLLGLLPERGRP
jgi:lysophospholipase L1-like esterase